MADRLKECYAELICVFTTMGYAILDATTGGKIQTLFKVMCGEAPPEDASEFLLDSDQAKKYLIEHKPEHWASCKKWSEWWRHVHIHTYSMYLKGIAHYHICLLLMGKVSRYKGFAKHSECQMAEGIQASKRRKHPNTPLW